jgi:hypothetical protein
MGRTGPARLTRVTKITCHVRRSQHLRLVCVALLFDNINHSRLTHVFQSLGFPLELTSWLKVLSIRSLCQTPLQRLRLRHGWRPARLTHLSGPLHHLHLPPPSKNAPVEQLEPLHVCGRWPYLCVWYIIRLRQPLPPLSLQALHRVRRMAHVIRTWYRARKNRAHLFRPSPLTSCTPDSPIIELMLLTGSAI